MSLFHTPEYFALHDANDWVVNGCVLAMRYSVNNDRWISPPGTFGGFSTANLSDMEAVLERMDGACKGPKQINLAPASHDQELFALSVNLLMRHGYRISVSELNYERHVHGLFQDGISHTALKSLNRAFNIYRAAECSLDETVYQILSDSRTRKGRTLSMSLDDLQRMTRAIHNSIVCFKVTRDQEPIAAAICINISSDVVYVYAWGDVENAPHSPTVMLANKIYNHCLDRGIPLMDIGTATEKDGTPNLGLIQFKKSLGFTASAKLTMVRDS